ncbi:MULTISPECIES: LysR family transcriptional regulator [Amycolatopsis]|uniref:LysR family transcriptional regulator n=1 Tax=Amycolatopsis thermalba TaxID=944492 RepID=A0ABY4P0G5_9PSEU|nr:MULTISPECIES: LysR family transcriptional regulator [Amycolatopsis]OXM63383.1 LysR family transcriptional regulator [Amycolatopsis sp. KNN50.9b]UQS25835.1 LysR family transcriptional regulator [Amycolatopsis thermalba]
MEFSFGQLEGFVAVAEERHFGRAAERLSMTQPPLSRQIQKLERSVGAQLLDRDSRGVRLTAAGEAFLVDARRLLALAGRAPDLARRIAAGEAGSIRIGFTGASAFGVLGRVLNTIGGRLPDLRVELSEMVTGEQVAALANGEIDLGLARPPFDTETFASRPVHRERLVLCVPAGHRLAGAGPVAPDDLANEPLIMHSAVKARYFYDLVVGLVPIAHRNVVHAVSQIQTMIWLVAAGRGVAFVPESATRMRIDGVAWAELGGLPDRPVELHLLWARESANPALSTVLTALEPLTAELT